MAVSFYSNSVHVDFDSVLEMDEPGMNPSAKRPFCPSTAGNPGIQLAVGPQPLWLRNHNSGPAKRIMVKRLATSPHDPLGITDSACKNQSVVVSVQYGPFIPYIPIRSTTIGKSRVAIDPIAMHTSWRAE
ncbi:senescence-associated carboxylesterase 101-like [Dorcoceras hygrometricum]|uniref:Senescence-associated carboxylesterase 101-like n=1 Tax=Dorcoceras hygrometricum TaxID=472368 RepID=A0A2Z7A9M1_9LAMI|nr:senescence-associated carboxylesterase 101-like [Dorcoceras hygrometricum]